MKIDRSNYEIWIIDWLDGNLNNSQVEQIKLFLHENPDLSDEFDNLADITIKPFAGSFRNKGRLKKSAADIPVYQFEYLCVGYLEKDLPEDQVTELKEIINHDTEKRRDFELIQKSRLSPPAVNYIHKNLLVKRTATQKVIRLSIIGLSAAAAIALIFMIYTMIPRDSSDKINSTALNNQIDISLPEPITEIGSDKIITEKDNIQTKKQRGKLSAVIQKRVNEITAPNINIPQQVDSLVRNIHNPGIDPDKIPVYAEIAIKGISVNNTLIAYNSTFNIPVYDDGRSKIGKFIAKTIREKILKEKTPKDSPLKAYEIAEAGVTGLNKLFGWQMALDEKIDKNGELSSVYF
ncbi:MAG: hypothetical protein EPN88_12625, partial [Bacteroidetes bacterium]